jgi:hypothetical protein
MPISVSTRIFQPGLPAFSTAGPDHERLPFWRQANRQQEKV